MIERTLDDILNESFNFQGMTVDQLFALKMELHAEINKRESRDMKDDEYKNWHYGLMRDFVETELTINIISLNN